MHSSNVSTHGMAVAPHHLASQSALAILREGGSAIEAMVAAAAAIAVVYPHMNGLGGDGFWLIVPPEGDPIAIDASGAAGSLATLEAYAGQRHIPHRGPQAALTVAGTVSGWDEALRISRDLTGRALPVARLLADAIGYAEDGIPVTASQAHATASKLEELRHQPGFSETWLVAGEAPRPGSRFRQPALAGTLRMLASDGLDSFYRGPLAERLAQGMATLGMPVTLGDLQAHRARRPGPLTLQHQQGTLWNLAPPTQGLVSLAILGITDRLNMADADDAQTVHRIVEATKRAFALRDAHITDPRHLDVDVQQLLTPEALQPLADSIDDASASPWGRGKGPGDTVWMGVVDNSGLAVSFIQSIYHEFGSGVVLPDTGIVWQNRGAAFSLDPQHLLALAPGKQPFHTLNPAAARLNDGRVMVYGSMGGDGQPQTQAALFTRYILQGVPLQESISRPRWLLGRTWGQSSDSLKLEGRFAPGCIARLRELGHDVEVLADFSEAMGHAGAIVRHPNGLLEGATDPRSNGAAAGY
ncbi:oxamate amidohydrolase [Klebsiella pneumoniae]|uniref:oxamate amidohydrolase n=1 Tax=Klebsiella pneumoniae TaxID=573 RepID=UPI0008FB399C|nr:oxamate amidohydrolase [Klebsiella pneumoniae]MBZ1636765.1 oxamate amidohydrolase [Klebsiella pneumoniae]OIS24686.1 gamma-glutamyltransferase [Klebsiella pneumoniae]HBT4999098.1 oxamate amidohydrolase [Klebsiella pneumoniae]HDK7045958.1 oxamate amidohydrolase [Klebsiella pneumoniae]HDK7049962.1 oxamate amidohydrolase [Klebsiella pneumoniae]